MTATLSALLLASSSSSASSFFFFVDAKSLHAVLWTGQCSSWHAREQYCLMPQPEHELAAGLPQTEQSCSAAEDGAQTRPTRKREQQQQQSQREEGSQGSQTTR